MPLAASRRLIRTVSACVAACMILRATPSAGATADPIDELEHSSIALIYLDNTEFGVGFVVASDANNSYLLTAAHVLGCADTDKVGCRDTVKVRFVGQLASTTGTKALAWKNIADGTDLALVKVARGNLPPVPILSQTAIDDEFYVIGFSSRIISSSDQFGGTPEVHDGNISRIQSSEAQNFLEASVPAYSGFSGGPIVDKTTRAVVGVFSGHLSATDENEIDYRGVGPAKILEFLVAAQALTHVPFMEISSEDNAAATTATDPINLPSAVGSLPLGGGNRPALSSSALAVSPPTPNSSALAVNSPRPSPTAVAVSQPKPSPSAVAAQPPRAVASSVAASPTAIPSVVAVAGVAPGPPAPAQASRVETGDFQSALSAANAGDPAAQYAVAMAYERGTGVEPDGAQGLSWLQRAAAAKYPAALTSLATAYVNGQGVQVDRARALELYENAANLGDARAAMILGNAYHYGKLGTKADDSQSKAWYAKGIDALTADSARGDGASTWSLGYAYVTGSGVSADVLKGLSLLELGIKQGSAGAANNLGLIYLNGRYVTRDVPQGIALLDTSVQLGGAASAAALAYVYLEAKYGVTRDLAKGFQFLNEAANLGHVRAMWQLGNIYVYGVGDIAPKNIALGCDWYHKAAALNYLPGVTQYARCLLETGPRASRDPDQGLKLLEEAAQRNASGAQMYLGEYYRDGHFVPKDEGKAFALFQSAARGGQRGAQFDLAQAYESGQGVFPDRRQAYYWYQLAANRGDSRAQQKVSLATNAAPSQLGNAGTRKHRHSAESHP